MMGPSNNISILLGFWWDGNRSSMDQAVKQMDLEVRALPPEARQKLQETLRKSPGIRSKIGVSSQNMGDLTV